MKQAFVSVAAAALVAMVVTPAAAQDPAPGWLGYAMGVSPSGGVITHAEAKWVVGGIPPVGGAFYSPWLGIETSDNLNLLQPVNPFMGESWAQYIEYFQWSPEYNFDSDTNGCNPGDVLHGVLDFNPRNQSYTITHTNMNSGWSVTVNLPVQRARDGNYKNYTIVYIVYEKPADCDQYPPEGKVTFYDIVVEYDNQPVQPTWTTGYVYDVCNNRANIVNEATIEITWDTSAENPDPALVKQFQPNPRKRL